MQHRGSALRDRRIHGGPPHPARWACACGGLKAAQLIENQRHYANFGSGKAGGIGLAVSVTDGEFVAGNR